MIVLLLSPKHLKNSKNVVQFSLMMLAMPTVGNTMLNLILEILKLIFISIHQKVENHSSMEKTSYALDFTQVINREIPLLNFFKMDFSQKKDFMLA